MHNLHAKKQLIIRKQPERYYIKSVENLFYYANIA